ncbi:MAG: hypothetical protein ACPGWR_03695 [Ardenticatenaceae bacterium]
MAVARLSFERREGAAKIEGTDKLPGVVNYYRGSDPDKWISGVPTYGEIVYHNLYPGIDLHYNGQQGQLKSTFVVAPRVDPKQIRWRYKGAKKISVDKSGQLHVGLGQAISWKMTPTMLMISWFMFLLMMCPPP